MIEKGILQSTFADNCRRRMREVGLGRKRLTELLGVTQPSISQMLSQADNPTFATVEKIASHLEVRPQWLLEPVTESQAV